MNESLPATPTPLPTNPPVSIRWVSSVADIPAELWETCFPPPLEGRWWYGALERAGLNDQFEFAYGVVETGARAVGIAPVFLMDFPLELVAPPFVAPLLRLAGRFWRRLAFQRTLFVGSPCSDEGTVGLLPETSLETVAPALQDALDVLARAKRASLVVWKDFPENAWPALDRMASRRGLFKVVSFPNTRLALRCEDFAGYLAQLKKSRRLNLRKKLKHSHDEGYLEEAAVARPDAALLGEMLPLFEQTYARGKTKFERLTPEFFTEIARAEQACFLTLRDPRHGNLVAFNLCFLCGPRAIFKYIGMDYGYGGNWYLYFRMWEFSVRWALGMGAREIQSGQTGYTPKFDVGLEPVPLTNYCKHRNRAVNAALRTIARRITWATLDEDLKRAIHGQP